MRDRLRQRTLAEPIVLALVWVALSMALAGAAQGAPACARATLSGINIAGAEFNPGAVPGVHSKDYIYPGPAEIAFARTLGVRLVRVPVLWERLQPGDGAALDAPELARLDAAVALASQAGLVTVIDVHNYARVRGEILTRRHASSLATLWRALALHYADREDVVFGLMNEPHDVGVDDWAAIAKVSLDAIRSTGSHHLVLVPGTNWDGAHSWETRTDGRSNADALVPFASDPRVVFEVHQYFDANSSGTTATCDGAAGAVAALGRVGAWARARKVRLFLGEFGVSARPECVRALDEALGVIERDRDVWYGWAYWAAGAWWGDYMFNVQKADGATPQGEVLRRRAAALGPTTCAASGSAAMTRDAG